MVHPAEAWSNLAFAAVAAGLVLCYGRADRHLPIAWFPAIVFAIGIGSFAFHASMVRWLHVADVAAIFLFTSFLLATHFQHAGWLAADRLWTYFVVLAAAGAVIASLDPQIAWIAIAAQGLAILWLALRATAGRSRHDLFAAVVFNQVGAAALWLDKGQVLCTRGDFAHVVQPHSLWHILLAVSLLFFYRHERRLERAITRA